MLTVRRSMLFTPTNITRFVKGVWKHSPDMVVLDLEDSVAASEKVAARGMVQGASQYVASCGIEVAVRINHDSVVEDCNAAIWPQICAVVLPKVETPSQINSLDALLTKLEGQRKMPNRSDNALFISAQLTTTKLFRHQFLRIGKLPVVLLSILPSSI